MTTTEQIQELQQQVNSLISRLDSNDSSIASLQYNLNLYHNSDVNNINSINTQISTLQSEDVDLHREIHDVNNSLINTATDLSTTTISHVELSDDVDNLSYTVSYNKDYQDNENIELHREIHNVNNSLSDMISSNNTDLYNINHYLADVPQSQLISDVDYAAITSPDPDIYYYVYESDE